MGILPVAFAKTQNPALLFWQDVLTRRLSRKTGMSAEDVEAAVCV